LTPEEEIIQLAADCDSDPLRWSELAYDKGAALANAMRHLGMFNDKLDVNVTSSLADRLARAKKRGGDVS